MPTKNKIALAAEQAGEERRRIVSHSHFFSYAWERVTEAPLYALWQKGLQFFRRFRAFRIAARVVTLLFTLLETGALVVLTTAVFLVLIPLFLALTSGVLLTALVESRHCNRRLERVIGASPVFVLFPRNGDSPCLAATAEGFARHGIVLIVSPYFLSPRGTHSRRLYATARLETPHTYTVRRYYFFSLRKHVLSKSDVTYMY